MLHGLFGSPRAAPGRQNLATALGVARLAASSILLVDADKIAGEAIKEVLTGVGYSVTVVDNDDDALKQATDHHMVILDVLKGDKSPADVCRKIRATPSMVAIPVLCISQTDDVDDRIRFLEAGADDVIAQPFDGRELEARVEALVLRFQRSRDLAPVLAPDTTPPKRPHMVAVFSPKGGVGATTIAVNTAAAIAEHPGGTVLLIDLDLQFGQVAWHLNLQPAQTLVDVSRDVSAQREPELLRTYVAQHESGISVLASPGSPQLADAVTAQDVERILNTAAIAYDSVVVDAGSVLDARSMAVLERADTVIFPVYPEIAALKALRSLLDYLNEASTANQSSPISTKATFVLNNVFASDMLKMPAIEDVLGTKIVSILPYDPFLYTKAVNVGVPIVRGAPRSLAAQHLVKLAASAFGTNGIAPAPLPKLPKPPAERKQRRLGGLLRRT
jgi:pilus assembly protein CpaE